MHGGRKAREVCRPRADARTGVRPEEGHRGYGYDTGPGRDVEFDPGYRDGAPGGYWTAILGRGQHLRIVDVEGRQSCSLLAYNADQLSERFNAPDTVKVQNQIFLTTGRVLLSDLGRVLSLGGRRNERGPRCARRIRRFRPRRSSLRIGDVPRASTHTAPHYRLYALSGTVPPKPGLVRDDQHGAAIAIEVYAIGEASLGRFLAGIAAPLAVGPVELEDGSVVPGFLAAAGALDSAIDITHHGGWRAYMQSRRTG